MNGTFRRTAITPLLALSLFVSAHASRAADLTAPSANPLEIRISPSEFLIAHAAREIGLGYLGTSPYYDLVLQTIYFINHADAPLTLEGGTIELLSAGTVLQQTAISAAEIARAGAMAAQIVGMKLASALDVYYSASTTLPEGIELAPTLTLEKGTAGLVDDYYLAVRALPDQVRITGRARTPEGAEVRGVATIPVREYQTKNRYILPLEPGSWFVQAYPGIHGHHRWTAATEHALDITMVDSRGSWARGEPADWRLGKVPQWEDWYAYNKQVLAAAAGTVIKVVDDVTFPLEFWNRGKDESLDDYRARIGRKQLELFMEPGADAEAVAGGNHIVIEHPNGEYSLYAHLAYGSIRVQKGQKVAQGEHIAGLGGTGEAPAVHLHFQVSDGPSMTRSRTLPVQFDNIQVNEQFMDSFGSKMVFQSGFFITAAPPSP